MKNIVLIGMPGTGKSTVGVLVAKSLLMDFVDTDLLIQKEYSCSLCDIIEKEGIDSFIDIENRVIAKTQFTSSVIATGGSAVYGKEAMEKLSENGIVVYIKTPLRELEKRLKNIHTRGVAMKKGTTVAELMAEREPLYERYAHITADCEGLTAEECVQKIVDSVSEIV